MDVREVAAYTGRDDKSASIFSETVNEMLNQVLIPRLDLNTLRGLKCKPRWNKNQGKSDILVYSVL